MVAIISIISFAVVLLAASSYSAPVDIKLDSSKLDVKDPNEQPVVNELGFNKESTSVPIDHKERSSEEKDSDEMTTEVFTRSTRGAEGKDSDEMTTDVFTRPTRTFKTEDFTRPSRHFEGKDSDEMKTESFTQSPREFEDKDIDEMTTEVFTRPPRTFEGKDSDEMFTQSPRAFEGKDIDEMTTEVFTRPPRTFEGKDSDEMFTQSPRGLTEDVYPSSTEESKKRTVEEFLFTTLESSTQFNQRAIRPVVSQEEMESSSPLPSHKKKNVDVEPSSSIQSFGKSTGLLKDETNDQSKEEFKKTIPIIPDKIHTETPSKKSVVVEPVEQEQLSQVQHQSNVEKTKSDN